MSLNYEKIKEQEENGNHWASYSDLFMVLSFVFLMLYVVSSIRNGAFSIQQYVDQQKLENENEDLREQLRVYSTLKEEYKDKHASQKEVETYNNLMSHLELLQDKAEAEKQDLLEKAKKNEEKKQALNHYQQVIRNIINANMLSQSRVNKRDRIIDEKSQMLSKKESEIRDNYLEINRLNNSISEKRGIIAENTKKIASLNENLNVKVDKIRKLYSKNMRTKEEMTEAIEKLREQTQAKIDSIVDENQEMAKVLSATNEQLVVYSKEKQKLLNDMQVLKETSEEEIKKQRMEAQRKIASIQTEAQEKEQSLKKTIASEQEKNQQLSTEVKELEEIAFAREKLAESIEKNLKANGINVNVNKETGELVLQFKDYFDTGKYDLKESMITDLKKFIPVYTKSLLGNKEHSDKVKNVEIIGFASPTFQGKLIDPKSLDPKDRIAVNYNLDLSFYRAKSIFNYIFDTKKIKYEYQKPFLPLVKVTGRSFLAEDIKGRNIASGVSRREYCRKYQCIKSQKVIIKFNLN